MDRIQKLLEQQMLIKAQLVENKMKREKLKEMLKKIEEELQDIESISLNLCES